MKNNEPTSSFGKFCQKFQAWASVSVAYAYYFGCIFYTFAIYWLFWLRYDDCNYYELAYHISIAGAINLMAFWSYYTAYSGDPGLIKWEHFRERKLLMDTKNKEKWRKVEVEKSKPPPLEKGEERNKNECHRCGVIRVAGVHHCSKCGRCVYKMDHHCVWTDNCVGWLTIKPFMLFNFYIFVLMAYQLKMIYQVSLVRNLKHL